MDLQQPLLSNNSSFRSAENTCVLLPPISNNLAITTTANNSQSTTATVENIASAIASPSPSPTNRIVNHPHSHHNHRNSQSLVTQKSNQVSTVLLYNIPIVSLFIEGQERLCLAQISNTLLKQFSYNEIHNRRVALGITCVQCTPVQLEILRRAGAMPVSSRRCGMITRREAERLCKSFLGDNTPPRLPEDFAFNVQHNCSWGCRGSFLPSRYNSSRAKCIKCHYCGMFFSPNKFIFHSHRVGPGDKYVQPDAANFNSWRRHMVLSGQPAQEVIYAWEDVKAMFNGGTRKRLMTNSNSSPLHRVATVSPSSCSTGGSSSSTNRDHCAEESVKANGDSVMGNTQKVQKSSNSVNTVTAAAAVVGVTAVAVGSTVRPLNLHFQTSTASGLTTESAYAVGADMHLIPAAALSRSFMMDYMWQHAHHAAKNTYNQHYQQQQQTKNKCSNSPFNFPWINAATSGTVSDTHNSDNHMSNINYSPTISTRWPNSTKTDITRNLTQIINTSAFKPVIQHHQQQQHSEEETHFSTKRTRQLSTKATPTSTFLAHSKTYKSLFSSDEDDENNEDLDADAEISRQSSNNKHLVTDDSEALDDDILVDIETTEDEKPFSFSTNTIVSTSSRTSFTKDNTESPDQNLNSEHQTASDEDVIDVVHNDNDDTVLEFASLTPFEIHKHNKENNQITLNTTKALTSPVSNIRYPKESYSVDYSNAENVPPPALSISPKSNSSCSRSSECFYINGKANFNEITAVNPNSISRNTSKSPDIFNDQEINCNVACQEKSTKNFRKRQCEKLAHNSTASVACENIDKEVSSEVGNKLDSSTKYKKKSHEPNTKEAQIIEALTQKYELTYYNTNNTNSKNNFASTNSNSVNNNLNSTNSNEFWQMARLCMQRPINYEHNQKVQQQQQEQQHNNQQLSRLPTFYYRQQQFLLSPVEQQQQQQQQQNSSSSAFSAATTQQVYLHLQQHQAAQKSQSQYLSNETLPSSNSNHSSSHTPVSTTVYTTETTPDVAVTYINMRQNNHNPHATKINRANEVG